jgi:hypothetical protein
MNFKSLIAAAVLAVAPGPLPVLAQANFPDVAPNNWAYQAILNLRDKYGCAKGFPSGSFKPGEPATRAQLAALTSACLDEISSYVDQRDAALAAALRSELGLLDRRVVRLEVARQAKELRVGPYLGVGASITSTPNTGLNGDDTNTVVGGTIQGRIPFLRSGSLNNVSLRPFVTFSSENGGSRTLGGATVTYDYSVSRATLLDGTQVSKANIYAGLGGIWTSGSYFGGDANDRGNSGTGVGVIGFETKLSPSLVGFADVKLPFQSTYNYRTGDNTYSPVGTVGIGLKF